jgi:hypothetical protein
MMPLVFGLLFTAASTALGQELAKPGIAMAKPEEVRRIINEIALIDGMPPKSGEPQTDVHAIAIEALGKAAGPGLVAKITDTRPSRVFYAFQYTIGDLALALLDDIYRPPNWPFPDHAVTLPEKYGDFRDYRRFIEAPGSRAKLQRSWREFIERN